jgi:hypothetical protein
MLRYIKCCAVCAVITVFMPLAYARTASFKNAREIMPSEEGTISFRIKMLKDVTNDPHNHMFMIASNTTSRFDAEIIEDQLILRRYFNGCLRAAFQTAYDFPIGTSHEIVFSWNHASTGLFIDGRNIKRHALISSEDLGPWLPAIRVGEDEAYEISDLRVSAKARIGLDPKDAEFARTASCPCVDKLMKEPPQETVRGIRLCNFPSQEALTKIRDFIRLLPEDFTHSISYIVYVGPDRASKSNEGGHADPFTKSIVLKDAYYRDPKYFFHECAHLYDTAQGICSGVPDEKSEWARISGAVCYYKGADMPGYYERFRKDHYDNAILSVQGGQCPSEDLAIWVGAVYDYYLSHKTFAELLTPGREYYSPKNKQKLDFLLAKGFFSREIYDAVTAQRKE